MAKKQQNLPAQQQTGRRKRTKRNVNPMPPCNGPTGTTRSSRRRRNRKRAITNVPSLMIGAGQTRLHGMQTGSYTNGTMVYRDRELWTNLAKDGSNLLYRPGDSGLVRLDQLAKIFELYRLRSATLHYVTAAGTTVNGAIYLGIDFDGLDLPTTLMGVQAKNPVTRTAVWDTLDLSIDVTKVNRATWMFSTTSESAIGADQSRKDLQIGFAACVWNTGPDNVGELWIDYEIEFSNPTDSPVYSPSDANVLMMIQSGSVPAAPGPGVLPTIDGASALLRSANGTQLTAVDNEIVISAYTNSVASTNTDNYGGIKFAFPGTQPYLFDPQLVYDMFVTVSTYTNSEVAQKYLTPFSFANVTKFDQPQPDQLPTINVGTNDEVKVVRVLYAYQQDPATYGGSSMLWTRFQVLHPLALYDIDIPLFMYDEYDLTNIAGFTINCSITTLGSNVSPALFASVLPPELNSGLSRAQKKESYLRQEGLRLASEVTEESSRSAVDELALVLHKLLSR